jgi:hypothetical protein
MGRVDVALERLLSLADTSIQRLQEDPPRDPPDMPPPWLAMEEGAAKIIGLAAEFVDTLDEEGGGRTLRQNAQRFLSLVEGNLKLNNSRKRAYQRMMEAFQQASPDVEVDHLKVPHPTEGTGSEPSFDEFISRSDVKRYLADAEPWFLGPRRYYEFCQFLADHWGYPELTDLASNVLNCLELGEPFHLWGCFLLLASHDGVLPTADPHRYFKLQLLLKYDREAVSSLKEAAKNIAADWRTEKEQRSQEEATAADEGIDPEVPKAGDTKKPSKTKQPVVEIIHIKEKEGDLSFQLVAKGQPPVSIEGSPLYSLFALFVDRIAHNVPDKTVLHEDLNKAVDKEGVPELATNELKNAIKKLNHKLYALGRPPVGERFILNDRDKGYRLNTSCEWWLEKAVRDGFAPPDFYSTDPQVMAQNTPDDDEPRLPSRRRRRKDRRDDD